jgi:hypothetical protein
MFIIERYEMFIYFPYVCVPCIRDFPTGGWLPVTRITYIGTSYVPMFTTEHELWFGTWETVYKGIWHTEISQRRSALGWARGWCTINRAPSQGMFTNYIVCLYITCSQCECLGVVAQDVSYGDFIWTFHIRSHILSCVLCDKQDILTY